MIQELDYLKEYLSTFNTNYYERVVYLVERRGIEPRFSEQLAKLFGHACTTPLFLVVSTGLEPITFSL
jgi:hypothetical protein